MNIQDFLHCIETNEIPPEAPDHLEPMGYGPRFLHTDFYMDYYTARAFCTKRGMWAIVYREWVEKLAKWIGNRKVLEVMAGKGWLAKALAECGVSIIATDNGDWDEKHSKAKSLFPVIKMDAVDAVKEFSEAELLIVSWPPYEDDTICRVCEEWGEKRPIIYIGEDYGGCNAPDEFFQHFKESTVVPKFSLVSWDGIHDRIFIGHYMKEAIRET